MSRPDYRLYLLPFTTIRELAPLFSPNRHGTCEAADNLTIVKVGIRLPSFFPYRHFKRKRIVEDCYSDFYKRLTRVQAQITPSFFPLVCSAERVTSNDSNDSRSSASKVPSFIFFLTTYLTYKKVI